MTRYTDDLNAADLHEEARLARGGFKGFLLHPPRDLKTRALPSNWKLEVLKLAREVHDTRSALCQRFKDGP